MSDRLKTLRTARPLVHCVANAVSSESCANLLLALGASPIMTHAPEEMAAVTAAAQATVLNTGTPDAVRWSACRTCLRAADHPVVLDPVGVGVSPWRKTAIRQLLAILRIEKPLYGSVGDAQRGKTDQDAFDSTGKILDLSVTVGMPPVGRTPGLDDGQQSDEPRRQIDHGLHGVGKKADGIRQKEGSELESHGQNRSPDGQPGVSADTGGHFSSSRHRRN